MPNEIKAKIGAPTAMTITLESLPSSASGVGQQSTMVDNSVSRFQRVHVYFKVTTGTTPTANKSIQFYLLKRDDQALPNIATDNAGALNAGLTVVSADQVYAVAADATSDKTYRGSFVIENPGPSWGMAVVQDTGVALNATASNHALYLVGENPEVQ